MLNSDLIAIRLQLVFCLCFASLFSLKQAQYNVTYILVNPLPAPFAWLDIRTCHTLSGQRCAVSHCTASFTQPRMLCNT